MTKLAISLSATTNQNGTVEEVAFHDTTVEIDDATLEDLEQTVVLVLTKKQAELLGEIAAHAHDADLIAKLRQL